VLSSSGFTVEKICSTEKERNNIISQRIVQKLGFGFISVSQVGIKFISVEFLIR
jgi:hypothetical protein